MELTMFAEWLNTFFANYDYTILNALHEFAVATNNAFTPFLKGWSLLAEHGLGMFLIGIVLMCFKKTRKVGVCVFGAVCCGALITNLTLKEWIARPRPFVGPTEIYHSWWQYVGSSLDAEFSFPSGHTTASMAAMTALFLCCNKKYSWTGFLFVIVMGISRNYLMMHYPSDVLGGMIVGAVGAVAAYYITKLIYCFLEKYSTTKICEFILEFDIRDIFGRRRELYN